MFFHVPQVVVRCEILPISPLLHVQFTIELSLSPAPLSYCCSLGQTNGVAHCLTMTATVT